MRQTVFVAVTRHSQNAKSKLEIQNSKQFQIVKNQKFPNKLVLDFRNWDLSFRIVSDFDIRISDFVRRHVT
jgi:hypothetical protein